MANQNKSEVIIIGAGCAGLEAASVLANSNIKSIVLERCERNSNKNFSSCVIPKEVIEGLLGKNPLLIERELYEFRNHILYGDSYSSIDTKNIEGEKFIVTRKNYIDSQVNALESKGVSVIFQQVARELIIKDKKICGVKTDNEEFYADIVIIAEGVNSILTKQSGLRKGELTPEQIFLFEEEKITLSPKIIEERFNLQKGKGIVSKFFTDSFFQMQSIGHITTNKDFISIGIGVLQKELITKGKNINECLEEFKNHPAIKEFINGGFANNYTSYILPAKKEVWPQVSTRLYTNGCLVIGGAALIADPFSFDISSDAIKSATLAAHTIINAKGDYSEKMLSNYPCQIQ